MYCIFFRRQYSVVSVFGNALLDNYVVVLQPLRASPFSVQT